MNLPSPAIIENHWYLLAEVPGYYGKRDVPCSMGIYIRFEDGEQAIYFVFLNGKEAYYGHSDAGRFERYTVEAALSQAWSSCLVSPDKWHVVECTPAEITNRADKLAFEAYLNLLRSVVTKHRNGEPVVTRPVKFHSPRGFHAWEPDHNPIP